MAFDPKTYIELLADKGQEEKPALRRCNHDDCSEDATYRAPRKRSEGYHWFCLNHVQNYNKQWNFFSGMSRAEMENWRRRDMFGHRPLWPLGGTRPGRDYKAVPDPFAFFDPDETETQGPWKPKTDKTRDMLGWSLETFGLRNIISMTSLRERYFILAKRYHPDVTGGDRDAEECLKSINEAYRFLKRYLQVTGELDV